MPSPRAASPLSGSFVKSSSVAIRALPVLNALPTKDPSIVRCQPSFTTPLPSGKSMTSWRKWRRSGSGSQTPTTSQCMSGRMLTEIARSRSRGSKFETKVFVMSSNSFSRSLSRCGSVLALGDSWEFNDGSDNEERMLGFPCVKCRTNSRGNSECALLFTFFRAGRRAAKRGHRRQRVHVVPPMHDLAVFDGNHRDEPVVVGGAGRDDLAVYLVFDDHDTRILRSVNDERVRTMQHDAVAVACVERYERLTTIQSLRPAWKNISKLEHDIVGDGIKIVVAIDETGQSLL